VVALLEPFIDTIVICTLTGLVIITTGVWKEKHLSKVPVSSGLSWVSVQPSGAWDVGPVPEDPIPVIEGKVHGISEHPHSLPPLGVSFPAINDVAVQQLFLNAEGTVPFFGWIDPQNRVAIGGQAERQVGFQGQMLDLSVFQQAPFLEQLPQAVRITEGRIEWPQDWTPPHWNGAPLTAFFRDLAGQEPLEGWWMPGQGVYFSATSHTLLYGMAVETSAPLTAKAFSRHLGRWGEWIVVLCVVLFAVSTAISWSYYGDRCANYLFGPGSLFAYKVLFLAFHLIGAIVSLNVIWEFGDVALSLVTIPNLLALLLLSPQLVALTKSYFERRPWES
jgi:hypothetical protein